MQNNSISTVKQLYNSVIIQVNSDSMLIQFRLSLGSILTVMYPRFEVEYALSEPTDSWEGRKGRIDACMLENILERPEDSKCLVCVCGPTGFNELAVQ